MPLISKTLHIMKQKTLLEVSMYVNLERNAEESNYIFMSCH